MVLCFEFNLKRNSDILIQNCYTKNRPHLVTVVQGCYILTEALMYLCALIHTLSVVLQDHPRCQQLSSLRLRCSKVSPSL